MNDSIDPQGTSLPGGEVGSSASHQAHDNQSDSPATPPAATPGPAGEESSTTRRKTRGGRRRRRPAAEQAGDGESPAQEQAASGEGAEPSSEGKLRRPRGGARRTRSRRAASETDAVPNAAAESAPSAEAPAASKGGSERQTKTRSRGGRRRRRDSSEASEVEAAPAGTAEEASERPARKRPATRRKATTRRGPASKNAERAPREAEAEDEREPLETSEGDTDSDGEPRKRRRRGSRGGRRRKKTKAQPAVVEAIPGEENELLELDGLSGSGESAETGRRGKTAGRRPKATREGSSRRVLGTAEKAAAQEAERTQTILVNANHTEEVRVAVCEGERIIDFQMVVDRYTSLVNDIYRGRVVNLEAPIGAAFVDFGQGRNGFLHASDVLSAYGEKDWNLDKLLTTRVDDDEWSSGSDAVDSSNDDKKSKSSKPKSSRSPRRHSRPRVAINDVLKKGQMVAAQITKDAIGDKGPTLTTFISIPGRYLVLMPSLARTGVSRKIEDEKERRRLKRILSSLNIQEGMGVIVRTAGIGKTKTELRRDLDYLMAVWEDFGKRLVSGRNPAPLYEESSVAIRTMRDLFNAKTKSVIVDDPAVHASMVKFAEALMPEHVDRIVLHENSRPLFHAHGIEQEFERIFSRRIELPSGGSIVFDQTEALVAIDVNSGRTREGSGFEDVALKANIEAAPEIARQIRLRDLGGILVVDFIDMMRSSSRLAVEREFRQALVGDRARSKVGRISQFGLLEMTRQRLGPGLSKLIFDPCPACRGSGRERTAGSRAQAILRRLGSALTQKGFSVVEVRAHPEVVDYLQSKSKEELDELKTKHNRELRFSKVPDQVEDSVLRYLRADGREVRPGGRRKR